MSNDGLSLEQLQKKAIKSFNDISDQIANINLNLDENYKRINHAYYLIFCQHYESFFILLQNNYFSSALLLLRSMLEVFVKSFYVELIEKEKNTNIDDILNSSKKEINFYELVGQLESHKDKSGAKFNGFFSQYLKSGLKTYEKLSLFAHGKGEVIKALYRHGKIYSFSEKQIFDNLYLANGLFIGISILLMHTQNLNDKARLFIDLLENHTETDNLS